nr:hypothetical protein GCM10020093_013500 [Planobispora longispora]
MLTVAPGREYGRADGGFTIRPGVREDYEALIAETGAPGRIVHAWALDGAPARDAAETLTAQDLGFFSLLTLVQALSAADRESGVHLDVLTAGTQGVLGPDLTRPEHATVAGIAKVVPLEAPWLSVRHIDLEAGRPGTGDPGDPGGPAAPYAFGPVLAELARDPELDAPEEGTPPSPVVLRSGRRWVRGYEPVPVTARPDRDGPPAGLREGGVYLVTGGLGGIGVTLAEDLARRVRARLVLLGRSGLPPRQEWDALGGGTDRTARAVAAVRRMEEAGAEVLVLAADVTDPADMRRTREEALARFGRIDGIVHAAGLPGGGMAEVKERAEAERVMAPKLAGTIALREAFGDLDLDFVVLCSSVTAVAGGFGQVDYCAANNFLDAYAQTWPGRVLSVNWGAWLEVGMAAEVAAPVAFRALQRGDRVTPLDHPVLTHRHESDDRLPWVSGTVSPDTHWLLAEHRVAGEPVLPGTGYLETVRHAFETTVPAPGPGHAVELRDVAFVAPLAVAEGAAAELRVLFSPGGDGVDFEVVSVVGGTTRSHARGGAAWVPSDAQTADLAELRGRFPYGSRDGAADLFASASGLVAFGPRWRSLRAVHLGREEELARLEAAPETAAELGRFGLHPALLDEATAFVSASGEHSYLPLGYGRITVHAPLAERIWSHARHRDTGEARSSPSTWRSTTTTAACSPRSPTSCSAGSTGVPSPRRSARAPRRRPSSPSWPRSPPRPGRRWTWRGPGAGSRPTPGPTPSAACWPRAPGVRDAGGRQRDRPGGVRGGRARADPGERRRAARPGGRRRRRERGRLRRAPQRDREHARRSLGRGSRRGPGRRGGRLLRTRRELARRGPAHRAAAEEGRGQAADAHSVPGPHGDGHGGPGRGDARERRREGRGPDDGHHPPAPHRLDELSTGS